MLTATIRCRLPCSIVAVCLAMGGSARVAVAQYRVSWGDMHGHTALSDGKGTLDEYFTHARDVAKLDFVVVSDHDFGNAAPWHMPRDTWRLTQDKADQYTAAATTPSSTPGSSWISRSTAT